MIPYKQLSLADIFSDCQNKFDNNKYEFLSILDETINLDEIVPTSFVCHFHAATGRPHKHLLYPMLKAFKNAKGLDDSYLNGFLQKASSYQSKNFSG